MTEEPDTTSPPPSPHPPLSLDADKPSTGRDDPALSPEQMRQLVEARRRLKRVSGALKMASFNGYTTLFFAILSTPFALGGVEGALVAAGLWTIAVVELSQRPHVRRMDPRGLTRLGWNQVAFMLLLIVYAVWHLYLVEYGEAPGLEELKRELASVPELSQAGIDIDDLYRKVSWLVYGSLFVLSIGFQGLWFARSYFARARIAREYQAETPAWVIDVVTPADDVD